MNLPVLRARDRAALSIMLLVACGCGLLICWQGRSAAAAENMDAEVAHDLAVSQARRVVQLRRERELFDERPRPRSEVVEPFKAVMAAEGLGAELLSQISISEPQKIASTPYERQQASLTVERIRVADLVKLLARWSGNQPLWTLRSLRLEKIGPNRTTTPSGAPVTEPSDRYTAVLTIENVHIAAGASAQTSPTVKSAKPALSIPPTATSAPGPAPAPAPTPGARPGAPIQPSTKSSPGKTP